MNGLFSALDRVNQCITIDRSGSIISSDKIKATAILEPYRGILSIAEVVRCIEAGTFEDNRLFALQQAHSGGFLFVCVESSAYHDPKTGNITRLQAFLGREVAVPSEVRTKYACDSAKIIKLVNATEDLKNPRFVGLFAGDLVGAKPVKEVCNFFFVEKIVLRTRAYTLPLLKKLWAENSFPTMKTVSHSELWTAAVLRAFLHEHFHMALPLPFVQNETFKKTLYGGAFEETKVDLAGFLCPLEGLVEERLAHLTAELLIADRLITYGSILDPADDYDALGSVSLATKLATREAFCFEDEKYSFRGGWEEFRAHTSDILDGMLDFERSLETSVRRFAEDQLKFGSFIRCYRETLPVPKRSDGSVYRGVFHRRHAEAISE